MSKDNAAEEAAVESDRFGKTAIAIGVSIEILTVLAVFVFVTVMPLVA